MTEKITIDRITLEQLVGALEVITTVRCNDMDITPINDAYDKAGEAITAGRAALEGAERGDQPVAWLYTLEYGDVVVNTKVSVQQLNYPFGVCGADYLAKNDDGVSYVRQTPLYKAQSVPDSLLKKLPGGKKTDRWDSARVADYNQGWNDYRKAVKGIVVGATPDPKEQQP